MWGGCRAYPQSGAGCARGFPFGPRRAAARSLPFLASRKGAGGTSSERPPTPVAAKAASAPVKSTPAPALKAAPVQSDAPFAIENLVLAYEAGNGRFPTAPEIAEALTISETDAAKGRWCTT